MMTKHLIPVLFALMFGPLPALADNALGGVDVVSLRDMGRPLKGDAAISIEWKGRSWIFANEANRAAFEANPRAYAPGFAGNCPVALSDGRKVPGLPEFAVVVGDTLYLTSDSAAKNLLSTDPSPVLRRAAQVWAKMR